MTDVTGGMAANTVLDCAGAQIAGKPELFDELVRAMANDDRIAVDRADDRVSRLLQKALPLMPRILRTASMHSVF